jgi:hypothetical protein
MGRGLGQSTYDNCSTLGVPVVAADTVADVVTRWWGNYSGRGVGLRGGTFHTRG